MKKTLLITLVCLSFYTGHSQTWSEWTRQKKTQIKYLLRQIAALQVYIGYAKKGYEIADKGLSTISNIKNGEFNLHRDFFSSLKMITPRIREYSKVTDVISIQLRIVKTYQRSIKSVRESHQFTESELDHITTVFTRLVNASVDNVEELIRLITASKYEMKDDERLKRIDVVHTDMQEKASMVQSFSHSNSIMAVQRLKEKNDIQVMKKLYGLNE